MQDRSDEARVLRPGRNCAGLVQASRAAVLVDASDYFARLEDALRQAEHSILIVGWDFDASIRLRPERDDCLPLGPFLRTLVDAKPNLRIHILVWSLAVIHAPGASLPLLSGQSWHDHPRITLRLDRMHPIYAAHHQKIVCVDGSLAFVGGLDLTVRRWDTCRHEENDPHRVTPDGVAYEPVHDVQMAVAGAAARALAEVVRARWRHIGDVRLTIAERATELWPAGLVAEHVEVPIAISQTTPAWNGAAGVHEIAALTVDLLLAARRSIYIEAQYFTARVVRRLIERSLKAPQGPEIVVVNRRESRGLVENFVMAKNRDRLVRHLRRIDRHGRFRIFYPVVPGRTGACEVSVHSKVVIIDDDIMRIGSSNLNNRSFGLDSECDLTIEAKDDRMRHAIAGLRERLLGEHLDVSPLTVAETVAAEGSLIRAIDRLNTKRRGLRPFSDVQDAGPTRAVFGTWLLDPARPFEPGWWRRRGRQKIPPVA